MSKGLSKDNPSLDFFVSQPNVSLTGCSPAEPVSVSI